MGRWIGAAAVAVLAAAVGAAGPESGNPGREEPDGEYSLTSTPWGIGFGQLPPLGSRSRVGQER